MKALVKYDDQCYLVDVDGGSSYDVAELFDKINHGRWPDECQDLDWIKRDAKIVCFMSDDSRIVTK